MSESVLMRSPKACAPGRVLHFSPLIPTVVHVQKNDVISSVRKHYCAIRVRVRVRVKVGISGNTFSVKRVFSKCRRTV